MTLHLWRGRRRRRIVANIKLYVGNGEDMTYYVMFRGEWRRVPHFVQRAWERIVPRLLGGCATSMTHKDGTWTGSIR